MFQLFNSPSLKENRKQLRTQCSEPEKRLWYVLRNRALDGLKFRRQQGIGPFIVDFYRHEKSVVIEVDGDSHFTQAGMEADRTRDGYLTTHGLRVIRVTNTDVMRNLEGTIEWIRLQIHNPTPPPLGRGLRRSSEVTRGCS